MRSYALNAETAKAAEQFSSYLDTTGKYLGVITRAEVITSSQGTEGVELAFKARDGREANYIQLWTFNKAGADLQGLKVLNALMAVLKLRNIAPVKGPIEKMDDGKKVVVQAELLPDLMGKPVGLVLQREEYIKDNRQTGYRMLLIAPFCAETERTATEVLSQAREAKALTKIIEWLADKPVRHAKPRAGQTHAPSYAAQHPGAPATPGANDFDDDIPF